MVQYHARIQHQIQNKVDGIANQAVGREGIIKRSVILICSKEQSAFDRAHRILLCALFESATTVL